MTEAFRNLFDALSQDVVVSLIACAASFMISFSLVLTKNWHGKFSMDSSEGIQKFHTAPTPRIGGIPIFIALILAAYLSSAKVQFILIPVIWSGLIAFVFGLAEDFTKNVGVTSRLLATMASGVVAWYLTGYSLTRLDIVYLDALLLYLPVSVLFTAFAVGGVANAINIIDGFNGLSCSASVIALLGLASIALAVGDLPLSMVCIILALAVLGFLFVNWPLGKIFLGDGGAYFVGFSLAWVCVLLAERHATVTAFVTLLVCIHPITEVLFSIYRRRLRHAYPGHPDRLHLHSLIKARIVNKRFSKKSQLMRNSITGMLVGLMTLIPVFIAQYVYNSTRLSLICIFALIFAYVAIYARLVRFKWYSPYKFLFFKDLD